MDGLEIKILYHSKLAFLRYWDIPHYHMGKPKPAALVLVRRRSWSL